MDNDDNRREQATSWFARLQSRNVSTAELTEFARWRREPENAQVYRDVEAMWDSARPLRNDAEILKAVESAQQPQRFAHWWRRPSYRWFGLAGGVAVASIAAVLLAFPQSAPTYRTAIGEQSIVWLDDGTRMQLDTDTEVSTRFGSDRRHVRLEKGQAYFDVQHDATRPFVVEIDDVAVTALGTRFDVDQVGSRIEVSLLEGSVQVASAGKSVRLRAGESVRVTAGVIGRPVTNSAVDRTNWRDGRLTFADTPVVEAIAEMNRYTDRTVTLVRSDLSNETISGDFATGDIEGFRQAIDTLFGTGVTARKPPS